MKIVQIISGYFDASAIHDLREWQTRVLDGILRGVIVIWALALVSGINNVVKDYRREVELHENPLAIAASVIAVYLILTVLLTYITFVRTLRYELRVSVLLFVFYALGAIGLSLSSFSGDGRIFLFAFVILAAVLLEFRYSLVAFGVSLLTLLAVGWMQVAGVMVVPAERQVNSMDVGAWISGSVVFIVLSIAALISITYLLRALGKSLDESRKSLHREKHLSGMLRTVSDINQLIVREQNRAKLLTEACERLIRGRGYCFAWIGLLEPDGVTLKLAASAGDTIDAEKITVHLDQEGHDPFCAARAIHSQTPIHVESLSDEEQFLDGLLHSLKSNCSCVALPLFRAKFNLGVLAVVHNDSDGVFDVDEINLLQELANDLAYALENLHADEQRRALTEASNALLFSHDADHLWSQAITVVHSILNANHVAIYLYDHDADRLSCPYSFGLSAEYVAEINRRFHDVPGVAVLTDPRPVIIQDVQTDQSVSALRELMLNEGIRSYAVFPFYTNKGLSGAFVVYRNTPGPFSDNDLTAGQSLVHMIGLALENVQLYSETRRKASETGRLYAAAQDMASSLLDTDALLVTLIHHMTEALNATSGYISAVNLDEGLLRIMAEYWSNSASLAERAPNLGDVYSLRNYPAYLRALTTGKVVILQADDAGISEAERRQFKDYGVLTIMFVPLMAQGEIQGGVEIWESRSRREFSMNEINLVQAMAGHAASVIKNARLFESLRVSEEQYRTLIEQASDGIFVADGQRHYVEVNSAGCQMLGYTRAEILNMTMDDLALPEDISAAPFRMKELNDGKVLITERQLKRKDNSLLPVEISAKLLPNGNLQGIVRDITERKLAEKALTEREAYFRALIENSAEGVTILDAQGNMRYVAPAEERLTGTPHDEALGQNAFKNMHPDDVSYVIKAFTEGISTSGMVQTVQYRLLHKNGEWRYFEATGHNMLNDPHVAGIVVNYRDITDRKRAEEDLIRRAHELEALAAASAALRTAQNVTEMIPVLAKQALRAVGGDYSSIFLLDAETGDYVSSGWYSSNDINSHHLPDETILRHYPGEGITGRVAITGEIYVTEDIQRDPNAVILEGEANRLKYVHGGISLPIRAQEKIIGVMHVWLSERRKFSEMEIRLLIALAETAGNAIHRAILYEQTLEHAEQLALAYDNTLAGWARALELRDEITEGHTRRVTELTIQLARELGVPENELVHIRRGALLHDIGKMGIPDSILRKPGPLTINETKIMELHPQYAREMLAPISFLNPALDIPYCHHEHWDGTGYPRGVKGDAIPIAARIFSVVDVWDALTTDRPYRLAWEPQKVREYIKKNSGKYFDPRIVETFLQMKLKNGLQPNVPLE